jgi:hypothetical protein
MIYLLTAIGLAPGVGSTVHIYTQTIHRTQWNSTQNGTYITIRIHKHNNKNIQFTKLPGSTQNIQTYMCDDKCNQNNMRKVINEKAIEAANFILSMYLLLMVDTLLLRTSLPLHYTSPSYIHPTSLQLSTLYCSIRWNFLYCIVLYYIIQSDQKVSLHLMITIKKVRSNVQSVTHQSPDIYWHAEPRSRRPCSVKHTIYYP